MHLVNSLFSALRASNTSLHLLYCVACCEGQNYNKRPVPLQ